MRRSIDRRLAALEQQQPGTQTAQLEVVVLDDAGKFVEVRWGEKPMARITKEYWEQL